MMEKFDFLLGSWNLKYRIPKSAFSEADTGSGAGMMRVTVENRVREWWATVAVCKNRNKSDFLT